MSKITFTLKDFDKAVCKEIDRIDEDKEQGSLGKLTIGMIGVTFAKNVKRHLMDMKGDKEHEQGQ